MQQKQLSVRLYGKPVGTLEQLSSGKLSFCYDHSAHQMISVGMPIRDEPYVGVQCEAFFGGLLPESETVKKIIAKRYGISHMNTFSLLKAIGYDCAGAISFHAMDEPVNQPQSFALIGKILDENALYQHIKVLPSEPLFLGFEELRLSLAGVQDKAAICMVDNQMLLPTKGCLTTHILKPAVTGFEGIIENEYFCLKLAHRMGLPTPTVEIRQIKDIQVLLIERYDRRIEEGRVSRIHQEDFCQALGVVSSKKYQNEGGPGFKECFALLKSTSQPAINRNMLISGLIFNFFISSMDAHAKNFSLLHVNPDYIELTPFYDLICTGIYPTLSQKMAMKIGNQYHAEMIFSRHWQQLGLELDFTYPVLKKLIIKQGETLIKAMQLERENFMQIKRDISTIDKVIARLNKNISETLERLEKG